MLAHRGNGNAFRDRGAAKRRATLLREGSEGGIGLDLYANDFHVRPQGRHHGCKATNQTTTTNRHNDRVNLGGVLKQFQTRRALSGNDGRIIERMDEDASFCLLQFFCCDAGLCKIVASQNDIRSPGLRCCNFGCRGKARHDDCRINAKKTGLTGHTLRVIACRDGNHAACAFFSRQERHFVGSTPLLEGANGLKVFELERNVRACQTGQGGAGNRWRAYHCGRDALMGALDVLDGNDRGGGRQDVRH